MHELKDAGKGPRPALVIVFSTPHQAPSVWQLLTPVSIPCLSLVTSKFYTDKKKDKNMTKIHASSIDASEIEKFSKMADEWWLKDGKFKPLHQLNPCRIKYITDTILKNFGKDLPLLTEDNLAGLEILDIGCGGGLLAEPFAQKGAQVTAIDASFKNIQIAKIHAEKSGLNIDYQNISVEDLSKQGKKFDVILCMEVIEHVADTSSFMAAIANLLKDSNSDNSAPKNIEVKNSGILFMATINRTLKSFAMAIVGAEYVLNWLPRGTHSWEKFLKPSEIEQLLRNNNLKLLELTGVKYNLLQNIWQVSEDISVNYMLHAVNY